MSCGKIDVHAHLLPAVDDGCPSLEDSLACARIFVAHGYTHAFCTPHVWPSLPHNNPVDLPGKVADLQSHLDARAVPLKLYPGGELTLGPHLDDACLDGLVSYHMRSGVVLIDYWCDRLPPTFAPTMKRLRSLGLTVVLAHPERMAAVHDDPGLADYFRHELGLLLQGNLGCLSDPPAHPNRRAGELLLRQGHYHLLGSDCHNAAALPSRLAGLRTAVDVVGAAEVERLTSANPARLLGTP